MENLNLILNNPFIQPYYFISMYCAIFFYLKYGIEKTSSFQKRLTTVVIGAMFGLLWYFVGEHDIQKLITTFTFTVTFHSLIMSWVFKKRGFQYDDK